MATLFIQAHARVRRLQAQGLAIDARLFVGRIAHDAACARKAVRRHLADLALLGVAYFAAALAGCGKVGDEYGVLAARGLGSDDCVGGLRAGAVAVGAQGRLDRLGGLADSAVGGWGDGLAVALLDAESTLGWDGGDRGLARDAGDGRGKMTDAAGMEYEDESASDKD